MKYDSHFLATSESTILCSWKNNTKVDRNGGATKKWVQIKGGITKYGINGGITNGQTWIRRIDSSNGSSTKWHL